MKKLIYIIITTSAAFNACVKEKKFPAEPHIEFVKYVKYGLDSADCIISFKDGDGDIGIKQNDTITKNDFMMKYLYKGTDGEFHPFDYIDTTAVMDTFFISYRIPYLTPDGQYKALDGEILAKLRVPPLYVPGHSVVKFEIYIRDRAGHVSNRVQTNEISL